MLTKEVDMQGTPNAAAGAAEETNLMPIVARRRTGHWVSAGMGVVIAIMLLNFFISNPNWQWDVVAAYVFSPLVIQGLMLTLVLTLASTALGLLLGAITAFMRLSSNPTFRLAASLYIWFIRSIPQLVLILFIFFFAALVPTLSVGIPFGPEIFSLQVNDVITRFNAAVVGLGVYLGAYVGEILRGGIMAVPQGQFEAGKALGMTDALLMRRIISPQAIRVIIPAMANEMITMFKATSLVSVIGAAELLTTVQLIYARTFEVIPLLLVACLWYLLITSVAMAGQSRLERHFGRGYALASTKESTIRRIFKGREK